MKPGNSYLNVCLLKVVVLLSNHESHVTKTFSFFSFFFWIFFYLLTPSSYIVFLVYFMPFIYIYQEMTYIEVTSCSYIVNTAQKMKFPINDFFSFMRIWSHLLKKSLMESFIFCAASRLKQPKFKEKNKNHPRLRNCYQKEFCIIVVLNIFRKSPLMYYLWKSLFLVKTKFSEQLCIKTPLEVCFWCSIFLLFLMM